MAGVDPTLARDVVIVVPGIMGSELVDAGGRPVWAVSRGAAVNAIRTLGGSIRALQLPRDIGDGAAPDGVKAVGLVDSLHVIPGLWSPINGYDRLLKFLRSERFRLIEDDGSGRPFNLATFPYDWRLSNRHNARLLIVEADRVLGQWRSQSGESDAKVVLICHSMGGPVARWFAEREGGADWIRAIVTLGTPFRGSINALSNLVNGVGKGIGPLRVSFNDFARSLPALYQLLPQYDCITTGTTRSSIASANLAALDSALVRDAAKFHEAIAQSSGQYALHKVVGFRQPTATTASVAGSEVVTSGEIDGRDQGGDGTVPRHAAEPDAGRGSEVHEVAEQHGQLQHNTFVLDLIDGILSRQQLIWQTSATEAFGVELDEIYLAGDQPVIHVTCQDNRRLLATVFDEFDAVVQRPLPISASGELRLQPLMEGAFRVEIKGGANVRAPTISKPIVVIDPSTAG